MPVLIVVNEPRNWPLQVPGVRLVAARDYLTDPEFTELKGAKVFNLCRSYRYQATGYYVSLLAEARGHKPMPDVTTLLDLKSQVIIRVASGELDDLIQRSLAPLLSREFTLSIYFGRNLAKRHDRLAGALFKLFRAPFLRARFAYSNRSEKWYLQNIEPVSGNGIPEDHRPFAVEMAQEYFLRKRENRSARTSTRYDLAILWDPTEAEPPSDERALARFTRAAESVGFSVERISRADYGRLAEFDALFLRETTSVDHHTYRFARRAVAQGLVVVDDPESILKCTNKVFLAELLERHGVPVPKTLVVHRQNIGDVPGILGLPVILKKPDSSFSQGVVKVEDERTLTEAAGRLLEGSDLIIAQEYMPTDFDWRVGVFDRKPLYVCRYHMARGHWQIIKRDSEGKKRDDGRFDTLAVEDAPPAVVKTALRAANLIGDGLYGVDLKEVGRKVSVIEVNDNPSIDSGVEDRVLRGELYRRLMGTMMGRVEQRKER